MTYSSLFKFNYVLDYKDNGFRPIVISNPVGKRAIKYSSAIYCKNILNRDLYSMSNS